MRFLWLALSVFLVGVAIAGAMKQDNPQMRIGLYFLAAAGGLWLTALVFRVI